MAKRIKLKHNPKTGKAMFPQGASSITMQSDTAESCKIEQRSNYGSDFTIDRTKKNKNSPSK